MSDENSSNHFFGTITIRFISGKVETRSESFNHNDFDEDMPSILHKRVLSWYGEGVESWFLQNEEGITITCGIVEISRVTNISEPIAFKPPAFAEFMCALFVERKRKNSIIGDLCSDYQRDIKLRDKRRADWLYRAAVIRSIWPLACRWLSRVAWASVGSALLKWLGS